MRAGEPEVAKSLVESYLVERAEEPRAWFLLAACKHALRDLVGAASAFSRTTELNPKNVEAYLGLATVAHEAGDARSALEACDRGLEQSPAEHRLHHAAAFALEQLGRNQEALARYDAALAIQPAAADVLHDRGLLLARLGRLEQAELNYRAYLRADPQSPRARGGLADALLALRRYDDVIQLLAPPLRDAALLVRRGMALAALHRLDEARRAFAEARAQDAHAVGDFVQRMAPGADPELMLSPENIFISRCYAALGQCNWSSWDAMIAEARRAAADQTIRIEPAVAFMVRLLPLSGIERHAVARQIAARMEKGVPVLPRLPTTRRDRTRIGLLSPDFREHLNAYLLLPLFELLDRRRFELYAYSLAADDRSRVRARLRAAANMFRDLEALTDDDAAHVIRADDIDVLVDVAGHTTGGRYGIVARRPARLNVNYLGFSNSLGSARVDYAIADRVAAPLAEEWSEALAYVPVPFFLYDYRSAPPEISVSRAEYGLPEGAFVFCAFHRAEKISPDAFMMWMDVLAQVPRSVMWFHPLPSAAVSNLRKQASGMGIDPARLVFAPFEPSADPRYLARQRLGDLMLDALHHNAMTTACDALAVGLPVLTLQGDAVASRAGASLLHAAGLPQLVTHERKEFVEVAVRLANEPGLLRQYRETLQRRKAPLFDTPGRVRALEAAFEHMLADFSPG